MKFIVTCCLLWSSIIMNAQDSLTGIWNTGKDNTKIEISEVNGTVEGKTYSSDNASAKIGKLILKDVHSDDGIWKGKIFAAKMGKWMDAVFKVEDKQLFVTVKQGWKSKTLNWVKE